VYSLAYGDQPAIICDLVDWAARGGFPGSRPARPTNGCRISRSPRRKPCGVTTALRQSSPRGRTQPEDVHIFSRRLEAGDRSHAVCNATGLTPAPEGLAYPPPPSRICACDAAEVRRRAAASQGQVEVVSSLDRDGRAIPYDIRFGVWVVFRGRVRLHPALLHGIRRPNRPLGPLCVDVQNAGT